MPSLAENIGIWGSSYDWARAGHEWSDAFGGTSNLWNAGLWPRLLHHLPTETILEIGCGRGRWIEYLRHHCHKIIGVDVVAANVEACRQAYDSADCSFFQNDGFTLSAIEDDKIGFLFSFDSLVHADRYVLGSYIAEAGRVLQDGGWLFLHHSNLYGQIPESTESTYWESDWHWRAHDVNAGVIKKSLEVAGLVCRLQELIRWSTSRKYIDCLTLAQKQMALSTPRCSPLIFSELLCDRYTVSE